MLKVLMDGEEKMFIKSLLLALAAVVVLVVLVIVAVAAEKRFTGILLFLLYCCV